MYEITHRLSLAVVKLRITELPPDVRDGLNRIYVVR
jgi:hypothetical protein